MKVPKSKRGKIVASATVSFVHEWEYTDETIGMCHDTTYANTGIRTAACIKLQEYLDRHHFWLGCRKYIGEVILTHVWECLEI